MPRRIRTVTHPTRIDPQTLPVVAPGSKPENAVELYRWRCPMCGSMPSLEVTNQGGDKVMAVDLSPFSLTVYLHELGGRGYSRYYYANGEDRGRWEQIRDALLRKLPEIERMLREMEPPHGPREDKPKSERPYWNTDAKRNEERSQIDVAETDGQPGSEPTPPESPRKGPAIILPDRRVADRFNFRSSMWARAILILSSHDVPEPVSMRWLKRSLGTGAESVVLELISQRVLVGASKDAPNYVVNRAKLRQFVQGDISEMRDDLFEEAAKEAEPLVIGRLEASRGDQVHRSWFSAQPKVPAFVVEALIRRLERVGLLRANVFDLLPNDTEQAVTWYVRTVEEQAQWTAGQQAPPPPPEPPVTPPAEGNTTRPPAKRPAPPMDREVRKEVDAELRRQAREIEGQRQITETYGSFRQYVLGLRVDATLSAAEVQKRFSINNFAARHLLELLVIDGYLERIGRTQKFVRTDKR